MTTWYQRDPDRLRKEIELMQLHSRATLRTGGHELMWCEGIRGLSRGLYGLAVTYPERFPFERPQAFVVSPVIRKGAPHLFSNGALCLFNNPFAYDPKITAIVVRNRAVAWIACYEVWFRTGTWSAPEH